MSEPMKACIRVAAPTAAVHRALTDPAALRAWLAEHAEVELPHRFEFWGRYTPEGDAPHQRLLHVSDRSLRFEWRLDGEDTTVEIDLDPEDTESTLVTLSQSHFDFQEALSEGNIRGVLQTFWALALANLADYAEGREPTARVDFTSPDLRADFLIAASRDAVYDSLVDSEKASAWFGYPIGIEPRVGGRFAMGGFDDNPHPAMILELEPGRRMAVDWGPTHGVATWELEDSGGSTRLTIVQSGFSGRPPWAGWSGTLAGFAELRRFHEVPGWRPRWVYPDAGVAA
jgi:uncharacterized protein YndB with AHSA1/START domain